MNSAPVPSSLPPCRSCGAALTHTFVDLGPQPLCQKHVEPHEISLPERFYPLHAFVCDNCFLVQLAHEVPPDEIFNDQYAYFSSFSDSWLAHAKAYVDMATTRFDLGAASKVVELASNDGYLLRWFVDKHIPVLGVEPSGNTAQAAIGRGVPTVVRFFGTNTASELRAEGQSADLIVGNNVLAHVPDLNDFIAGMKLLLKPGGTITMEFPHLLRLMQDNQFDTIYHEHWSYFSLVSVQSAFARHGLIVHDVDELPTHGGSLRIYAAHAGRTNLVASDRVRGLLDREISAGLKDLNTYAGFGERVMETKRKLLSFLIEAKRAGKHIVGYGAPGKGNTLLNYCGIRTDFIDYTVDRSPHKQGRFLPGTRIPIHGPERIAETKPDYVLILPWNLKDEISQQMAHVRSWGGKFVVPIPQVTVL